VPEKKAFGNTGSDGLNQKKKPQDQNQKGINRDPSTTHHVVVLKKEGEGDDSKKGSLFPTRNRVMGKHYTKKLQSG